MNYNLTNLMGIVQMPILIRMFLLSVWLVSSVLTVVSCKREDNKKALSTNIDSVSIANPELIKKLQASIDSITPCRIFETSICISIDVTDKAKREAILSSIHGKLRENNSTLNYTVLIYGSPGVIEKLKETKKNYPFTSEDYKAELVNDNSRNTASHFALGNYYLFLGEDATAEYTATLDTLLMKRFTDIDFTTSRFTYLFPHQQNFKSVYFECITGTNSASPHRYGKRIFGYFTPETASVTVITIEPENMTEGIEREVPEGYR